MAATDYYLCDRCHQKTFYDANLPHGEYSDRFGAEPGQMLHNPRTYRVWPDGNIGWMFVLCLDCAPLVHDKILEMESAVDPDLATRNDESNR